MNLKPLLLAAAVSGLAACGGGGGSGDPGPTPAPGNPAWVSISGQSNGGYVPAAGAPRVRVSGQSFVSPTWWGIGATSTAGVTVTWTNQTSGATGTAACSAVLTSIGFVSYVSGNNWTADVPVVPGPNLIQVVASEPSGLTATDTSVVTPDPVATATAGTPGTPWYDWDDPVYVDREAGRAQWVVLAPELAAAGLVAGVQIRELHLHAVGLSGDLPSLGLRVQGTALSTSTAFVASGWSAPAYPVTGTQDYDSWIVLRFTAPFVWNGTDHLLFDLGRVGGGPGPYAGLTLQTGLPSRMAANHGTAADYPFEDGRPAAVWDAIPELRLSWTGP